MRHAVLALVLFACGSSSATQNETENETGLGTGNEAPDEPIVAADEDPRALFAAQSAALESHDSSAFVEDFARDAVFVGPVADAVYLGHDAIESALSDVVDASGEISVTAEERHFASHGAIAWSVHDVSVVPAEVEVGAPPSMRFRVSSIYRREQGWTLAAQAWSAVVPRPDFGITPAALEARAEASCAAAAAEVQAWLDDDGTARGTMWRDNPSLCFAGAHPTEVCSSTIERADAGLYGVQAGPGGVRARALGDDVCMVMTNQIVRYGAEGADPAAPVASRLLALFVGDELRLAHEVAIVPDAPPLPQDDPGAEEAAEGGADPE